MQAPSRKAELACRFYPSDPVTLERQVLAMLDDSSIEPAPDRVAGYAAISMERAA